MAFCGLSEPGHLDETYLVMLTLALYTRYCQIWTGRQQGKRILSEQDLEQVVLIPPCSQSLVLDAEFCSGLLSQ